MCGVAPHRFDLYMGDGQETRRNNYNMSQPQYNYVNVNLIVIDCINSPERSHNNQNKQNNQLHDRWSPHSVPNGPTSVSWTKDDYMHFGAIEDYHELANLGFGVLMIRVMLRVGVNRVCALNLRDVCQYVGGTPTASYCND